MSAKIAGRTALLVIAVVCLVSGVAMVVPPGLQLLAALVTLPVLAPIPTSAVAPARPPRHGYPSHTRQVGSPRV